MWQVTAQAVHQWRRSSCPFFRRVEGRLRATRSEIRAAKVIKRSDFEERVGGPAALGEVLRRRIVHPSDDRFSLEDVDASFKWLARPLSERVSGSNGFVEVLAQGRALDTPNERWRIYREYGHERLALADIPGWFWDREECPRFIAAAGGARVDVGRPYLAGGRACGYYLSRSDYWSPTDSGYEYTPAQDSFDFMRASGDHIRQLFAVGNLNWEIERDAWAEQWRRFRPRFGVT